MNSINERVKVESIVAGYADAINCADISSMVNAYSSDGLFIPSGFPSMWGPEEVQQKAARQFREKLLHIEFDIKAIRIENKFAFVHATSLCELTSKATGAKETNKSKDFFVLIESENQWKILRYMFNPQ